MILLHVENTKTWGSVNVELKHGTDKDTGSRFTVTTGTTLAPPLYRRLRYSTLFSALHQTHKLKSEPRPSLIVRFHLMLLVLLSEVIR